MNTNFYAIEKKVVASGWTLVRVSGSHHVYKKRGNSNSLVIPNHGSRDISINVIKNIECVTGLSLRR